MCGADGLVEAATDRALDTGSKALADKIDMAYSRVRVADAGIQVLARAVVLDHAHFII